MLAGEQLIVTETRSPIIGRRDPRSQAGKPPDGRTKQRQLLIDGRNEQANLLTLTDGGNRVEIPWLRRHRHLKRAVSDVHTGGQCVHISHDDRARHTERAQGALKRSNQWDSP